MVEDKNFKMAMIIDGNYILHKNIFWLHQNNLLYGKLHEVLLKNFKHLASMYSFDSISIVSDSKSKSWRRDIYSDYKSSRQKNDTIDWEFVYTAYDEVKRDILLEHKKIKVYEKERIEGDDYMFYISKKNNEKGISNLIISSDHDIKQLIRYNSNPLTVNIMSNELIGDKGTLFIPNNMYMYMEKLAYIKSDNFFKLDDSYEYKGFLTKMMNKEKVYIDNNKELFLKLIKGDKSDNIMSVYTKIGTTGKLSGIGEKTALKLYDMYISEFKELDIYDKDFNENVIDLISEVKKINDKSVLKNIDKSLELNKKLIDFNKIPENILNKMEYVL